MSRVVIDVMGSDLGVQELVKGVAQLSMEPQNEVYMVLVGDALEIFKPSLVLSIIQDSLKLFMQKIF